MIRRIVRKGNIKNKSKNKLKKSIVFLNLFLIFLIFSFIFSFGYILGKKTNIPPQYVQLNENKKSISNNLLANNQIKTKNKNKDFDIEAMIIHHEGRKDEVYTGPAGERLAGVGHLLDVGVPICDNVIQYWLQKDIAQAEEDVNKIISIYNMDLDPIRYAALVDMAYQLGFSKLSQLKTMLCALRDKRWNDAEIAFSKTTMAQKFKQLRINTLRKMLKYGTIEGTDLEIALLNQNKYKG